MVALIYLNVWHQRRPGSLSTGAGGPMGVLRIRGSVGSLCLSGGGGPLRDALVV